MYRHNWNDLEDTIAQNNGSDNAAKRGILEELGDGRFDMGMGSFTALTPADMNISFTNGFLSMSVVLVQPLPPSSKEVHSIPLTPSLLFLAFILALLYAILWTLARSNGLRTVDRESSVSHCSWKCLNRRWWRRTTGQIGASFFDVFGTVFQQGKNIFQSRNKI